MRKNAVLALLLLAGFYSYGQRLQYNDLTGSVYEFKDSSKSHPTIRLAFKDSLQGSISVNGQILDLNYSLDSMGDATLLIATSIYDKNGSNKLYLLLKKSGSSDLKLQGFGTVKPTKWDDLETVNNTILLTMIKGTVSPPK